MAGIGELLEVVHVALNQTTQQRPPITVLHIPHASTVISADIRSSYCVDDAALADELLHMTDWYTDELFALENDTAVSILYPVSRLVVDPERFADDDLEPMASRGRGVVYTHTSRRTPLRHHVDADAREQLLSTYYWPHHERLTSAVDAALAKWNSCLVIDCHSFGSKAKPYELDQSVQRPDICLGTDAYHSPRALVDAAQRMFSDDEFSVAVNRPFSGALVPFKHYRNDVRVKALMVEVNRGLYMDEQSGERLNSFDVVRDRLQRVLRPLIAAFGAGLTNSETTFVSNRY